MFSCGLLGIHIRRGFMAAKEDRHKCKLLPYKRVDAVSIQDAKQNAGWNITAFDLPKAWNLTQGEGVVIGVLDTGVDLDHNDLVENLLPGANFIKPGKDPVDDNGHGSHCAGILVASNNEIGVVGVCPKAKVMPIKVLNASGTGNMLQVAEGIRWAVDHGAHILSMSLGCPFKVQQVRKAIQYAASKGVVTFVAAGNAGRTKEVFYPAAYPETIAIGAIDKNFCRANFSNTGQNLDFMAPGVDILSTVPDNWYATLSGTSMAQPFACGVAALVLSYVRNKRPDIKLTCADDYRNLFRQHTIPVKNGDTSKFFQGFGIIDPNKLMDAVD